MALANPSRACARFDQFDVDFSTGILQCAGVRVPVQAQPLQVLRLLLQADGKVVTREEICKLLWPQDTFVDFELGVNTAVKKLRQALSDPADTPKFIETLPRIGYRFLVPVEWVPEEGQKGVPQHPANSATSGGLQISDAAEAHGQPDPAVNLERRTIPYKKWIWLALGIAAVVLVAWASLRTARGRSDEASAVSELVPLASMSGRQIEPAVSPDGSQVAFSYLNDSQHTAIYVAQVGGEKPLQLTDYGDIDNATWSPDGQQVAFNSFQAPNEKSIFVVPALGGLPRRLYTMSSPNWGECGKMSWSPDGKSLIFTEALDNGARARLSLLSLSNLTARPLTAPVNQQFDCDPTFSPDGTKVAFVRGNMGAFLGDVFVFRLPDGEPQRLTFDNSGGIATWAQDGKEIIFSSRTKGVQSLWRISASGGQPRRVAGAGDYAVAPSMSRKGNLLAYTMFRQLDTVWQLNLKDQGHSAGPPVRLLSSNGYSLRPNSSPDGKHVVFESDRMGYSDIWVCQSDGSNCNQLTKLNATAGTARWSPDGRYIVFEALVNKFYEVYLVEAAGGIPRQLSTFPVGNNGAPNWSRDGQYIYFYSAHENGPYQLWKMDLQGGPPVRVTAYGGVYAMESADQRFLYYAKFEQPGIWKMPLGGGGELKVLNEPEAGEWCLWTLAPGGIYFVNRDVPPNGTIEYFDFATKQSTIILRLDKPTLPYGGLAISPDGKSLLFGQEELNELNVMLVKNFR